MSTGLRRSLISSLSAYVDSDAAAFIAAANITVQAQKDAIINLVQGLKTNGTWDSKLAIYPFVGGIAASHAVNLKSPGTYNLIYPAGAMSHSASGMAAPSGNIYADTGLVPATAIADNISIQLYQTVVGSGGAVVGREVPTPNTTCYLWNAGTQVAYTGGKYWRYRGNFSSVPTGKGFASFIDASTPLLYVNGTKISYNDGGGNTSAAYPSESLLISASNLSQSNIYLSTIGYVDIGQALLETQLAAERTVVTAFQTALSRA